MREQSARDDLDWICLQKSKNIHINRIKDREIGSGHLLPAVIYLQKMKKFLTSLLALCYHIRCTIVVR